MIETLTLGAIILGASAAHRLFGFGFASISIPLIALFTDLEAGVLLLLLLSSTIALQNLLTYRSHVNIPMAMQFIGVSVLGVAIGYVIVDDVSARAATLLASGFIIGIALLSLLTNSKLTGRAPLVPAGIAAGVSNVISAVNGPLIALFFSHATKKKEVYLGTVSFVFLAVNLLAIAAQLAADRSIGLTVAHSGAAFCAMFAGSYLGAVLQIRIRANSFKAYALTAIVILAFASVIHSF